MQRAWKLFQKSGWRGIRWELRRRLGGYNDYSKWVRRYDTLTPELREKISQRVAAMKDRPLISVLMPTYNPNPAWLREAIESVRGQIYPHWELCIADDASPSAEVRDILKSYCETDPRIKVAFRPENGHISAASNSALELAVGPWVALMDHDDLLPAHALFWVADCIAEHPGVQLIYSDEDKVDEGGHRFGPYFKSDWNVDLFRSQNMFSHLGVLSTELMRSVGGFRAGLEGSQDWDLVLRCITGGCMPKARPVR
jgi:glycosyltransferase involved in cell wall biosynthesis